MMKKKLIGKILALVAILLLAGILIYFYIQLNRMEKVALEVQAGAVNDSNRIGAIVNFFNSNVDAQE
jgi:CHASE3 domain sensor protein